MASLILHLFQPNICRLSSEYCFDY
uniref:Uncharacterized protein n=1 Tax=Rhizophora mucronata TaxID=61149 RepID=A0A2P2QIM5_RHIMU